VRTPPEQRDEKALAASVAQTCNAFQLLDKHLADRDYVIGDQFTAGDIPVGTSCYRYMALDIDRPATPHLMRWYERLQEREVYRRLIMLPLE